MFSGTTGYIILAVMGVLLVFLLLQVFLLRSKVSVLTRKYQYFMTGENGASLERQLSVEVTELREMTRSSEDMLHQHELLSNMQIQSFQRSGLVKYDAFDDSGDKLSFSLTLLDGANNGFVLSSLVGRENSRIYVKPILNGECREAISSEEAESIGMALAAYEQPRHVAEENQKQARQPDADRREAKGA